MAITKNPNSLERILKHPDREEIISKLILDISPKDIHDWLSNKYSNPGENKFIIAEKYIKAFKDNYLDLYSFIKDDLVKTNESLKSNLEEEKKELELSVKNNPEYVGKVKDLVTMELDIKTMLANMISTVENRAMQLMDKIQEDPNIINSKVEYLFLNYFEKLGPYLEKWHKYVLQTPDQVIQHNVTVQHIDQYVQVVHDAIKETLSYMDVETSLKFMEIFSEMLSKVKMPSEKTMSPAETRLAEVKLLNENINKKINNE